MDFAQKSTNAPCISCTHLVTSVMHMAMYGNTGCPASYFFLLFWISPTFSYFCIKFLLFPTFWLLKANFLPIFCNFLNILQLFVILSVRFIFFWSILKILENVHSVLRIFFPLIKDLRQKRHVQLLVLKNSFSVLHFPWSIKSYHTMQCAVRPCDPVFTWPEQL